MSLVYSCEAESSASNNNHSLARKYCLFLVLQIVVSLTTYTQERGTSKFIVRQRLSCDLFTICVASFSLLQGTC